MRREWFSGCSAGSWFEGLALAHSSRTARAQLAQCVRTACALLAHCVATPKHLPGHCLASPVHMPQRHTVSAVPPVEVGVFPRAGIRPTLVMPPARTCCVRRQYTILRSTVGIWRDGTRRARLRSTATAPGRAIGRRVHGLAATMARVLPMIARTCDPVVPPQGTAVCAGGIDDGGGGGGDEVCEEDDGEADVALGDDLACTGAVVVLRCGCAQVQGHRCCARSWANTAATASAELNSRPSHAATKHQLQLRHWHTEDPGTVQCIVCMGVVLLVSHKWFACG